MRTPTVISLLSFLGTLRTTVAVYPCDDNQPCNVISSIDFANVEYYEFDPWQTSPGNSVIDGVTYDTVIQWTHAPGAVLDHSFTLNPQWRRATFNCEDARMWFDGITVPRRTSTTPT